VIRLRCGRIFIHHFIANFLLNVKVKGFWKSISIWWNYDKNSVFWLAVYIRESFHFLLHRIGSVLSDPDGTGAGSGCQYRILRAIQRRRPDVRCHSRPSDNAAITDDGRLFICWPFSWQERLHRWPGGQYWIDVQFYYPRDAMLARSLRQRRVRPSVRPSVTRRYFTLQSESRIVKCTPSDSPITLSFWWGMIHRKIRKGSPQRNVPYEGGLRFFGDFRPVCRHISRTVHFRHKVTMGR